MAIDLDKYNPSALLTSAFVWLALACVMIAGTLFMTVRVGHVTGEEIGILLNKINGKITLIEESGVKLYNGITHSFYVLDRTLQTLEMTEVTGRGDRAEKDDLKIKTIDGSDVYVDLKVQYRVVPEQGILVINTSGPGDNYKRKWARDYIRALCRDALGELTTEEFYDTAKRNLQLVNAQKEANRRLNPFGIRIDSIVLPQKPHFYAEYEAMIKNKKLADQAVLEEKSKAQAAQQRQHTRIVEANNLKNVAIEEFQGKMQQKIIQAKAEGERVRKKADAYYEQVTIGADAELYQMQKLADANLAKKKAEAQGMEALKKALEGEGGRNMVKMEYARKLKQIKFTGVPYTVDGHTERFEHIPASAIPGIHPGK